jgi:hypothetical protein
MSKRASNEQAQAKQLQNAFDKKVLASKLYRAPSDSLSAIHVASSLRFGHEFPRR